MDKDKTIAWMNKTSMMHYRFSVFITFIVFFHTLRCKVTAPCYNGDVADIIKLIASSSFNGTPIVVYETSNEGRATYMARMLDLYKTQMIYDWSSFPSFLEQHMMSVIKSPSLEEIKRSLHFHLFCRTTSIVNLMSKVIQLDKVIGQGSLLRHFSTWLIISPDDPQPIDLNIDNVAWIRAETNDKNCTYINRRNRFEMFLGNHCVKHNDSVKETTVHTLLWTPGGRRWSPVCWMGLNHQNLFESLFPNSKNGLNGRKLQLLGLEWSPFATKSVTNGTVKFEGASLDVTRILGSYFNFSFDVREPSDGLWGTELDNGSWTGMIGALQRTKVDFIPIPYVLDAKRKAVVDFSPVFTTSQYHILYRRVIDKSYSWFYFLSSFKVEVYMCIIASLLWSLLFGLLVKRHLSKNQFPNCGVIDIGVRALLRQGITSFSENTAARILTWSWCMFCLLTIVCYTANLVAFATVDKHKPPFSNLQELAETDYKIYYFNEDYVETVIKLSDDPVLKKLAERTMPVKTKGAWGGDLFNQAAKLLKEGRNVLVSGPVTFGEMKSKSCDIEVLQERVLQTFASLPFKRHSPLLKMFQNKLQQLKDRGVIDEVVKKWSPAAKPCQPPHRTQSFPLDLLKPVLIVCAAGVIVAFVVLLVERFGKTHGLKCFYYKELAD